MRGTPAADRVQAETGALSKFRSLAGYVTAVEGERYPFAMLADNFRVAASKIDAIMEAALNRVVRFRQSSHMGHRRDDAAQAAR